MRDDNQKLTLDRPVIYQIKVPGQFDKSWTDWGRNTKIAVEYMENGQPVGVLTGTFDQAGLHGLLRLLYSRGVPLVSVLWIEKDQA